MTVGRGRSLAAPSPGVAADGGQADPALQAALVAADLPAVQQALFAARVFVAVAAQLVSTDAAGGDKESEMALLLLDGRSEQALPVFSSVAALAAWAEGGSAGARPVAVTGTDAWAQAVAQELAAVVVDVAGPHSAVLDVPSTVQAPPASAYRLGSWPASKRLLRALRRCGATEAYLLDAGAEGRPAIGLVLSPGTPPAVVVQRLAGVLDRPVDVALLDESQREAVRAAGVVSEI